MIWIFAAVVLVLAVAVPGFRKVLLVGFAVICGLALLIWFSNSRPSPNTPVEAAAPLTVTAPPPKLIPVDQVEVGEIRSDFGGYNRQVSNITARIFNNSTTDTLKSADYRLNVDDCKKVTQTSAAEKRSCTTVHEETGSFTYLSVPPQQARDVNLTLQPFGVTVLGFARIKVQITAARAE